MGCDIHLFAEYRRYDHWYAYGYSELRLSRNYQIFGMMSDGVRRSPEFSFEPRGLPYDPSNTVDMANKLYISNESDKYTSLEVAKKYEGCGSEIIYQDGKPTWVTHPDWHSHSWLSSSEFNEVIENYKNEGNQPPVDYIAIKRILETFEERGYKARVVFWFDN